MHEMSIAQSIVEIAEQHLPNPESKLRSVTVRIGELAGVVPDSLEFCFTAITNQTPFQGVQLIIDRIPLTGACKSCGQTSRIDLGLFTCPSCHSTDVALQSGTELNVTEIEIADEAEETA